VSFYKEQPDTRDNNNDNQQLDHYRPTLIISTPHN